jgi:hypothetical protein
MISEPKKSFCPFAGQREPSDANDKWTLAGCMDVA